MSRSIWSYQARTGAKNFLAPIRSAQQCPCCPDQGLLFEADRLSSESSTSSGHVTFANTKEILVCQACGWWLYVESEYDHECGSIPQPEFIAKGCGAALMNYSKEIVPDCLATLQSEIEQHLRGSGPSNAWAAMEDCAGVVLREFGYDVVVTGRTRDGGIDSIATASGGKSIAVQVKHSKNQVGVRVLRELIGTMYLDRFENGLLVTSSDFTSGATRAGMQAEQVDSWKLELINGKEFLGALNLSVRRSPPSLSELAPYLADESLVELVRVDV